MKKPVTIAAALSAFVLLSAFGPGRFGCGGTPEERFDRAQSYAHDRLGDKLDDLEATDAQRARISQIEQALFSEARPLVLSHRQVKLELVDELRGDRPDAAKLHALIDARAAAYTAFAHKMVDAAVEVHGVLTPEQRAKLNAELAERFDRQ